MKVNFKTMFLVLCLYLFTFQVTLESYIPLLKYWDEIFIFLFLFSMFFQGVEKWVLGMLSLLLILILEGGVSAFINQYQPTPAVFMDAMSCIKYVCILLFAFEYFKKYDFKKHSHILSFHVKVICWMIFFMEIADSFFDIWPYSFLRWGLSARMLCFRHPGRLAMIAMFLLLLTRFLERYSSRMKFYQYGMLLVMLSTLRALALATVVLYFALKLFLRKHNRINANALFLLALLAVIGGWSQFSTYYFSGNITCRILLTETGLRIAWDHFPFGAGLGTFASTASGVFYSPLYFIYGLNGYYGIAPNAFNDITDSFWGFLFGQFGLVGLVLFILFMVTFWNRINKYYMTDTVCYQTLVLIFLYLCYATVSSISLFHTGVVPLAFVQGICFARLNQIAAQKQKTPLEAKGALRQL